MDSVTSVGRFAVFPHLAPGRRDRRAALARLAATAMIGVDDPAFLSDAALRC
jgi:hypothetical protein